MNYIRFPLFFRVTFREMLYICPDRDFLYMVYLLYFCTFLKYEL